MSFLSRLLDRQRAAGAPTAARPTAEVIARALDAAGLRGDQGASIRATIDSALAGAGLAPPRTDPGNAEADTARGRFLQATHEGPHGRRDFRLYLPAGHAPDASAAPLLVMLHGCTQTAEDFAVGTRMNALADRHGIVVAYPQQVGEANQARCWNWFRPGDQRAGAGEPAILAGIVQQVAAEHRIDPRRVFVAGLSAGGAMAVVLGHQYPDLVRAIGVHSGLPYASAHDVPSAFAAMQGKSTSTTPPAGIPVPTIVFHGDRDRTVAPANADALVRAVAGTGSASTRERIDAATGHASTREVVLDASGRPRLERWTVHGAGHAWSGGDAAGTYTDPQGPDASEAMLRFFLAVAAD